MAEVLLITVPSTMEPSTRDILGREIIRFIKKRTKQGLDKNNNLFTPYSKFYKEHIDFRIANKSDRVNLDLTGEMLNTLEVLRHGSGFIKIGFTDHDSSNKARYSRENGRDFLGIAPQDLKMLISKFTSLDRKEKDRLALFDAVAGTVINGE